MSNPKRVLASVDAFILEFEAWIQDTSNSHRIEFKSGLNESLVFAMDLCEQVSSECTHADARHRLKRMDAFELHELVSAMQRIDFEFELYCDGDFHAHNRQPLPRFYASVGSLLRSRLRYESKFKPPSPDVLEKLRSLIVDVTKLIDTEKPLRPTVDDIVDFLAGGALVLQAARVFDLSVKRIMQIAAAAGLKADTSGMDESQVTCPTNSPIRPFASQVEAAVKESSVRRIRELVGQHCTYAKISKLITAQYRLPLCESYVVIMLGISGSQRSRAAAEKRLLRQTT